MACLQLGWLWPGQCFVFSPVCKIKSDWCQFPSLNLHWNVLIYRSIIYINTMSTTNLSFTTFSTDLYFINSGSLMALIDQHQRSPCPKLIKYRHTQVGIYNRARQWTLWKFTTHLFPYETWWTTEIQLFLLLGKWKYSGNDWHSHTHTFVDNHSLKKNPQYVHYMGSQQNFLSTMK